MVQFSYVMLWFPYSMILFIQFHVIWNCTLMPNLLGSEEILKLSDSSLFGP